MRLCDDHYKKLERRIKLAGLGDFMHMSRLQVEALADAAFEQVIAEAPKPTTFEPVLVGHIFILKHLMDNYGTNRATQNDHCPVCGILLETKVNLLDVTIDTIVSVSQSMLKTP